MLELKATLTCDRCHQVIVEMLEVDSADEARQRLRDPDWGCEDEDGDDVCAACWAKWDEKQALKKRSESATSVAAVDPCDGSTPV
jgi:hypothetical protein